MKRLWTAIELTILREHYADSRTADLAVALGRTTGQVYQAANRYGLKKSDAYLASEAACRLRRGDNVGAAFRFKPGQRPWNAGLPGSTGTQEACRATQFRPGNKPHTWVPIGSTRITKDGYLQRKVTDTGNTVRDWVAAHRLVWEAANGPLPDGGVVIFRPGMRTTDEASITADRLECLTRSELMRRNSVHAKYPPELARLVQLRGALQRQINQKAREAGEA